MQRIRKGDMVMIVAGKEKGKRGRVLHVFHKRNRVVVERVMLVKRHTKPSQANQEGGIIEKESSIHISNVMPVDPGTDVATRVKIKIDSGHRWRVGKSGSIIEIVK